MKETSKDSSTALKIRLFESVGSLMDVACQYAMLKHRRG